MAKPSAPSALTVSQALAWLAQRGRPISRQRLHAIIRRHKWPVQRIDGHGNSPILLRIKDLEQLQK